MEPLQFRVFRATSHPGGIGITCSTQREAFQRDRGGIFTFQGHGERKFKCVGLQPLNLVSVSSHKQLPCKKRKAPEPTVSIKHKSWSFRRSESR